MKTTHLVMPQDLNPFGSLFGGTMMGWMDICAAMLSFKETKCNCVTAGVSSIDFIAPVKLGDVVEIEANRVKRGTKSLTVHVKAYKLNLFTNTRDIVTSAQFVFVAVDENGRSKEW